MGGTLIFDVTTGHLDRVMGVNPYREKLNRIYGVSNTPKKGEYRAVFVRDLRVLRKVYKTTVALVRLVKVLSTTINDLVRYSKVEDVMTGDVFNIGLYTDEDWGSIGPPS